MAHTLADLEALERAIANGARVVQYEQRRVEYRSVAELLRARDEIRSELTPRGPGLGGRSFLLTQASRGTRS